MPFGISLTCVQSTRSVCEPRTRRGARGANPTRSGSIQNYQSTPCRKHTTMFPPPFTFSRSLSLAHTNTHTHTQTQITHSQDAGDGTGDVQSTVVGADHGQLHPVTVGRPGQAGCVESYPDPPPHLTWPAWTHAHPHTHTRTHALAHSTISSTTSL